MLCEFRTSRSSAYDHPEFTFKVDTSRVPSTDVQWFTETMEQRVSRGESFRENEIIQLGSGLLKTLRGSEEDLRLFEPDFSSFPIEWVDTVTQTLLDLRVQKDVCESYFAVQQALFPSLRDSAIVCTRLAGSSRIVMDRQHAESPDSGWFIGCRGDQHDHNDPEELARVSIYEAVVSNPRARMFLALPLGTTLEADESTISVYSGDSLIAPKRSSFVERWLARRGAG